MGKISKGILGGVSGTVGNIVGGSWKGIDYIRSKANRTKSGNTQKQLEQRAKFALMIHFQQPVNGLLAQSFKSYAVQMSGSNSALSYNIRNAVSGTYPAYKVDYSLFLMSRGDLPNGQNPEAVAEAGGLVTFSWKDNTGWGRAAATDTAMLVIYCPALKTAIYTTAGADRSAGTDSIDVSGFEGEDVYTWLGFFSADGRDVATSIFTGMVTVLA